LPDLGERRHFAFGLCDLASEATLERDFERAQRYLGEGLAIFTELDNPNNPNGIRWVLWGYGFLLESEGRPAAAVRVVAAVFASIGVRFRQRLEHQAPRFPFQMRLERHRQRICDTLGAAADARALADGQTMSLSDAIVYAQRACAATPAESALAD
jgi:hypothetical protein